MGRSDPYQSTLALHDQPPEHVSPRPRPQRPPSRSQTADRRSPPVVDFSSLTERNPQLTPIPDVSDVLHCGHPEFDLQPISLAENAFRHSFWSWKRLRVFAALKSCHVPSKRLEAFANCGSNAMVQQNDQGDVRVSANFCHDRFCQACGLSRGRVIAAALLAHVQAVDQPVRFATLTTKHNELPLADQVSRIYKCFANLRRDKFFKQHCGGGAAFLECKLATDHKHWHVHLHLLLQTAWMPQKELSQAWYRVTGDSFIVDVRPVDNDNALAGYVTKYVCKPCDKGVYEYRDSLQELVVALRGRHLCLTFGTWRGIKLHPDKDQAQKWHNVGRLDDLIAAARESQDPAAQKILNQLLHRQQAEFNSAGVPPP